MVYNFEEAKEQMIEFINDETRFKQTCFPSVFELEKCIQACEENVKKTQECAQGLEKWIQAGEDFIKGEDIIDVEPERGMNQICVKIPNAPTLERLLVCVLNLLIRKRRCFLKFAHLLSF
ncbi:hypothetical protein HpNP141_03800 [Helicobacter pylori]|nr:hypothetical protein KVL21_02880 [Helicobacter pylori]